MVTDEGQLGNRGGANNMRVGNAEQVGRGGVVD